MLTHSDTHRSSAGCQEEESDRSCAHVAPGARSRCLQCCRDLTMHRNRTMQLAASRVAGNCCTQLPAASSARMQAFGALSPCSGRPLIFQLAKMRRPGLFAQGAPPQPLVLVSLLLLAALPHCRGLDTFLYSLPPTLRCDQVPAARTARRLPTALPPLPPPAPLRRALRRLPAALTGGPRSPPHAAAVADPAGRRPHRGSRRHARAQER